MIRTRQGSLPQRERLLAVFDAWDDLTAEQIGTRPQDMALTEQHVEQVYAAARKKLPKAQAQSLRKAQVHAWLSDPGSYSPHVDAVALRRAMDFDWDVIATLTLLEVRELATALAAHPDPWSYEESVRIQGERDPVTGRVLEPLIEIPSTRRRAFLSGTDANRATLVELVKHAARTQGRAA